MLIVLSPAKTLDFETPLKLTKATQPDFLADSEQLVEIMQKKRPSQLRQMMGISEKLATLNRERFLDWTADHAGQHCRQAIRTFMGDVYTGLDAATLSATDLNFAQKHLRILSGLYGLLRPLDLMQAYRLEMGTSLKTPRGRDLYQFWGEQLAVGLNEQAHAIKSTTLINLASNEYFKAIDQNALELEVVTPVFKEFKNDKYRVLSFFAKKARGMMARFIIQSRAKRVSDLKQFDEAGYAYNEALSHERELVFTRVQPA